MKYPMRTCYVYCLLLLFILGAGQANGQVFGFKMEKNEKKIVIPFKEYNNLIVIPINVNRSLTLDFIVDTGVQNAILTEKIFGDLLNLEYQRKISIAGPGLADSIKAFIANGVSLELPGNVIATNRSLLVLEKDYLQLKNSMGAEVYGIIGYELFSRFIIEINYDRKEMVLHNPKKFKKRKYMHAIPLSIEKTKPYINTTIGYDSIKLMVDSGASHALLLDPEDDKNIVIPEHTITTNLGKGLGGSIDGKMGRIETFDFNDFQFQDVLASFPDPGVYNKNIKRGSRSGTLGGEILSRVNPIFDYLNGYIYFSKGKRFKHLFQYDMSGMQISAYGPKLRLAIINNVREDSPAYAAGIRSGDIIKRFNGDNIENILLSKMYTSLRRKEGSRIRMKIVRNGVEMKKCFRLKRLI